MRVFAMRAPLRRPDFWALVLAVCLCCLLPPLAAAQPAAGAMLGPFTGGNFDPFFVPYLNPRPRNTLLPPAGTVSAQVLASYGSMFVIDQWYWEHLYPANYSLVADNEFAAVSLGLSYAPVAGLELTAETLFMAQHGGVFDPFIQWFHTLFGFPNGGREYAPDNRYLLEGGDENGLWFRSETAPAGFAWVQLGAAVRVLDVRSAPLGLAFEGLVKLPVGGPDALMAAKTLDAGIIAAADFFWGPMLASFNLGISTAGNQGYFPERLTLPFIIPFAFSLEWPLAPGLAFVGTVDGGSSPFASSHPRLDFMSAIFMLGLRWEAAPGLVCEAGFMEEFVTFCATDIVFFAGARYSARPGARP